MLKKLLVSLVLLFAPMGAFAQSSPNFTANQKVLAPQWNSEFSSKVDVNNGTLANPAITGGHIDNTPIGGTTPGAGSFSSLAAFSSLLVPKLAVTLGAAGNIGYNTTTGRFDFGTGSGVVNFVRLSGDTLTGPLHMGANLLDGSNVSFTGGNISGVTLSGVSLGSLSTINLTDGSSHNSGVTLNFPTRTALIAFNPTNLGANVVAAITAGYTTAGDGGGATYAWNANETRTDTGSPNNNIFITPTGWSGNGRWVMQIPAGGVNVLAFGAKCDAYTNATTPNPSPTNDRNSVNNGALTLRNAFNGGSIFFPPGLACYMGTGTSLIDKVEYHSVGQFSTTAQSGGTIIPNITVASGNILSTNIGGSNIHDLTIARQGVVPFSTPEAAVAAVQAWHTEGSTCLTLSGSRVVMRDVQIYGCATGISGNGGEVRLDHLNVDASDFGINLANSGGQVNLSWIFAHDIPAANLGGTPNSVTSGFFGSNALTIGAAGSGYTDGDIATLSAASTGLTCTTLPQLQLHVVSGVVQTDSTWLDRGNCSLLTDNPAAFTGGSGTGLTLNLDWRDPKYRPGTGIMLNGLDGPRATNLWSEEWHIGLNINAGLDTIVNGFGSEPGWWGGVAGQPGQHLGDTTSVGVLISGCPNGGQLSHVHTTATAGWAMKFEYDSACSLAQFQVSDVDLTNAGIIAQGMMHFNGSTQGKTVLTNVRISSATLLSQTGGVNTYGPPIVFDANAKVNMTGVMPPDIVDDSPTLFSNDPATANQISIIGVRPFIIAMNAGSTKTVVCGERLDVNNTTASTITMPAGCPIGQDVIITDVGGQAAAHNITLSMPAGSTINGASTFVINTNFARKSVAYDGVAAYVN